MADFPNEIRINPAAVNKLITGAAAVLLLGIGVMTCFYKVEPQEEAVVLRLGKFHKTVKDQGLKFKLPLWIDSVTKVDVTNIRKKEFGFSTQSAGVRTRYNQRGSYENQVSIIVTGDLNVADVQWSTQYMVRNSYDFLYKVREPEETFKAMNEAVMREVVGDRTINEVLTFGRSQIQQDAKDKLQAMCIDYQLGIKVDSVILQNVNPPESVKASWNDVNQAQQERAQKINTAQAQLNKIIPKARGDAERVIEEANGYAVERVNQAQGDADLFKKVFNAYQKAPDVTRKRIYLETIGKVLATGGSGDQEQSEKGGGPRKIIMDEDAKGLLPLLNLNQENK
tara:strand:+ start:225 stop:1241 length:1017 start_codon:yes stop_codon:yes gene_type:complete